MALVDRVKSILLSPATEWQVIDGGSTTPGALYAGYIVPLAAIGPIAQVIGYSIFGIRVPFTGTVWRTPIGSPLSGAVAAPWTAVESLAGGDRLPRDRPDAQKPHDPLAGPPRQ